MALTREQLFALWAPPESPWSVWAKPVLFAQAPLDLPAGEIDLPSVGALPYLRHTAIVVDLPGRKSVLMGLALAQNGFQPVPLYNGSVAPGELIAMSVIANLLAPGADILARTTPKPEALPVFLLNADRMEGATTLPGRYDNRWAVVPQDMPSAAFLMSKDVRQVVVVSDKVRTDLAHVLHRYQDAKLDLRIVGDVDQAPQPLTVARPSRYRSHWYVMGVFAGLARNSAGGFGGITPDPNSGGGG